MASALASAPSKLNFRFSFSTSINITVIARQHNCGVIAAEESADKAENESAANRKRNVIKMVFKTETHFVVGCLKWVMRRVRRRGSGTRRGATIRQGLMASTITKAIAEIFSEARRVTISIKAKRIKFVFNLESQTAKSREEWEGREKREEEEPRKTMKLILLYVFFLLFTVCARVLAKIWKAAPQCNTDSNNNNNKSKRSH